MNRGINIQILQFLMLLSSCMGRHSSDAPSAKVGQEISQEAGKEGDTVSIDLKKSSILWKGTKMNGAGKHEGTIELTSGYFLELDGSVTGGGFTADMSTIEVTDIPEHEPIPRDNLVEHLKGPDFFDVGEYPISTFRITDIGRAELDSIGVTGNLTMKKVTKNTEFTAFYKGGTFVTRFTIDRFQWNIAYKGDFIDRTLVDQDIELTVRLIGK